MEIQEEKTVEEKQDKKEKIKIWLKDPYNLAFLGILIFAVIIRLYYFFLTYNQPLWWDEAEYMSTAKKWGLGMPFEITWPRMPMLQFISALIFKIGLGLPWVKLLIVIGSSIGSVIFSYLAIKEIYNKKAGLIVSFMMALFWMQIFNSTRVHTDVPLMFFTYLSIYLFWKGYIKEKNNKLMIYFGISCAISLLFRPLAGLLFISFLIFLIFTEKLSFFKQKSLWIALASFILVMSPYLLYAYSNSGNPINFLQGSKVFSSPEAISSLPIGWNILTNFPKWIVEWPFFILFLFGLFIIIGELSLKIDLIFKSKANSETKGDLLLILWLSITFFYFVFMERAIEDRWLMPIALVIFAFSAKAIIFFYNSLKKYQKQVALILIILILLLGGYYHINHANDIIKSKKDSYKEVRDAALWIKENSAKDDIIATASMTQTNFYAERRVFTFFNDSGKKYYTEEEYLNLLAEKKPKYQVVSVFEPAVPQWTYNFASKYPDSFIPVQAYFSDAEKKQPLLVIYAFKNYNFNNANK